MIRRDFLASSLALLLAQADSTQAGDSSKQQHSAIVPESKDWPDWCRLHERFKQQSKTQQPRLVFLGDSITQGWEKEGIDTWQRCYVERDAANYGIAGDRTQHVLWRIADGCFEGSRPELVVLLIGTNNIKDQRNSPEETVDGIKAVTTQLTDRLPHTRVLLLGILPCGETAQARQRRDAQIVNNALNKCDFGEHVHFLDVGHHFVASDGTLPAEIMPDFLHLSAKGYEILAGAIEPALTRLMMPRS